MSHVTIDDVLGFLVADTLTPSTMGAQLERLKVGLVTTPDPFRAREDAEARILEQARVLRLIDEFRTVQEFRPPSPRSPGFKTLERIQRATSPRMSQGDIAHGILRAYQKWGNPAQMRALVAVFGYVRSIAPRVCPRLDMDAIEATQAFRDGTAKRSFELASNAYTEALLALGGFLKKKERRK